MDARFSTLLGDIASTYSTDTIFIVGKGPSVDEIRTEIYEGCLVIGINDAERIAPVDITVFHDRWVEQGLAAAKFRARLYVAPYSFDAHGKAVAVAPYVQMTQASSDLLMQRFMTDELIIEDVLFLSALKIARAVAALKERPQTVYMVGFDFDMSSGVSHRLGQDFAPDTSEESAFKVSAQEYYFLNTLYFLRDTELQLKHVGTRAFSACSGQELNATMLRGRTTRPSENHVAVVAELTTNHFGDRRRLERMIRCSKAAGADFVKLQKRDVSTFYTPEQLASPYKSPFGRTFADYRNQLELSVDDFEFVSRLCLELGIGWFASVLDKKSFQMLRELDAHMMKLPSTISEHRGFLEHVATTYTGPLVLSTGMTDANYEQFVVESFQNCDRLYLMQCTSSYPTLSHDCNIGVVRHYHELSLRHSQIVPAYSSHDIGSKASVMAVAAGARMVEKHVKLGATEWAHFDAVAVDLSSPAFREYVDAVREAEVFVGSSTKQVHASEHHKYRLQKTA
jgi:sialic acid synthase SpsE